jgi:hypothetical protein
MRAAIRGFCGPTSGSVRRWIFWRNSLAEEAWVQR